MSGALRELIAHFGISADTKEVERAEKKIEGFVEKLKSVGEAIGVAFGFHELKEGISSTVEAAARLGDLSERLGVSTQALQQFQYAASLAGVDAEGAAHSLGLLNRTIGDALTKGGESAQAFTKLGVALKGPDGAARDVNDVLLDLSDSFSRMPDQQTRAAYAMQLFGREGQALLPVLSKGREELAGQFDEFQKLGGGMSDSFIRQAKQVDDEQRKLSVGWTSMKSQIVGAVLPALLKLEQWAKGFIAKARELVAHTHLVQDGLHLLGGAAVTAGVWKLVSAVRALAAGELAAVWPLALVAVGLFGLYLLFDELRTMIEGGQTVLGDFIDEFAGVETRKEFVEDLKKAVRNLEEAMTAVSDAASTAWAAFAQAFGMDARGMLAQLAREATSFGDVLVSLTSNLKAMAEAMAALSHGNFKGVLKAFEGSSVGKEIEHGAGEKDNVLWRMVPGPVRSWIAEHQNPTGIAPMGPDFMGPGLRPHLAGAGAPAHFPVPELPQAYLPRNEHTPVHESGGLPHVQNTFNTTVNVDASNNSPQEVADRVTSGISTAHQRDADRARNALRQP